MNITLEQGIKEVEFWQEAGLHLNPGHVQRIIDRFGEDAAECFQEAAEDLRVLAANAVAEQDVASNAIAQLS